MKEVQEIGHVFEFAVGDPVCDIRTFNKGFVTQVFDNGYTAILKDNDTGEDKEVSFMKNAPENFYTSTLRPVEYAAA